LRWQWYAGLTLIVWGFWGLLPKLALRTLDRKSVLVWDSLGALLVGLVVLASRGFRVQTEPWGVFYAMAYGVCGLAGAYLFLLALREGKASVVVPFTAMYPVVTLALGMLLLRERPTAINMIGVAFAIVAVILLSRGD
jgi:bacterial/archaeal transporter family protein